MQGRSVHNRPAVDLRLLLGLLVAIVTTSLLLEISSAHIIQVDLDLSREPLKSLTSFGFNKNGYAEINVSHVDVFRSETSGPSDTSQIGFLLAGSDADGEIKSFLGQAKSNHDIEPCILSNTKVQRLFDLREALAGTHDDHFSFTHKVDKADRLTLYLANCAPRHHAVSMHVDAALFNREAGKGGKKNYLSAAENHLALFYFVFFAFYFVVCCLWQYTIWRKFHGIGVKRVVHLLGIVVACYMFVLWSLGTKYSVLGRTGTFHGWETVYHCSYVVYAFSLLALIVLGLPDMERNMSDVELKVLTTCLSTLVVSWTYKKVFNGHSSSSHCEILSTIFNLLTIVSLTSLAGMVVLTYLPSLLRKRSAPVSLAGQFSFVSNDAGMESDERNRKWYITGSLYAVCVWLIVWLAHAFLGDRHVWAVELIKEVGILGFYLALLMIFRPKAPTSSYVGFHTLDGFEEEELIENEEMEGF